MASEIPSLDPCENLRREIDRRIHAFEQQGAYLKTQATDVLKDAINNYTNNATASSTLNAAIAQATVNDAGAGSTALTRIRNFTGSCLDSVYNEARVFASKVDAFVNDRINDFTSLTSLAEFDLLTPLRTVRKLVGIVGLSDMLTVIDQKIQCLSDSEVGDCLDLVDDFNDRVDDVLSYLGFGADATFDLDDFISNQSLSLDADSLANLKTLDAHMDDIVAEASANASAWIPTDVLPESYF